MQTIFLEFAHKPSNPNTLATPAATGSDSIFYIDGRWSYSTRVSKINERVAELRNQRPHMTEMFFLGYTISGSHHYGGGHATVNMTDPNPPEWATAAHKQGRAAAHPIGKY